LLLPAKLKSSWSAAAVGRLAEPTREKERGMKRIFKRSLVAIASVLFLGALPKAQAAGCSTETLRGAYGFFVHATILPAGTPRSILGSFSFDGQGNFTNTLTMNDNGAVIHAMDSGTYTVDADCTGKISTNGGTRTIEIVLVDGGMEFYQLRTDDPHILFQFNAARKQLRNDDL
jgi:hypothetical protein